MNKKIVSLFLALMLMMTAVVYAEGLRPSKDSGAMTEVVLPSDVPADFNVDVKSPTEFSQEVFEEFDTFLKEGGNIVDYFPEETMAAIEAQLPAGFDTSTLQINEFMPLVMEGISEDMSDLTLNFEFPTKYDPKTPIVTLVGHSSGDGDDTQWFTIPCTVYFDGSIDITFTSDILNKLAFGDAVLTVLSGAPSVAE